MNTGTPPDSRTTESAAQPPGREGLVYVVDDDEAVRDSMRWLLEANGFEVNAFASAEEFLARLPNPEPVACLLLDVRMPGMSGLELHEELARRGSTLPLIFITGHGDVPMAVSRMKKGAHDFLEKPFSDEQLRDLVAASLARAEAARRDRREGRDASERVDRLTGRERQVLDLIVAGRLNKQIADDLGISIKTVEAHRANIMDKLGARTMADLMRIALRAGAPPAD
ncbi:MAG: DNA-binding response regulator [Burkholderiales bacterium]|nr:MAG: DNA-binding response regulator [Burkholderiales bacterium]